MEMSAATLSRSRLSTVKECRLSIESVIDCQEPLAERLFLNGGCGELNNCLIGESRWTVPRFRSARQQQAGQRKVLLLIARR